MNKKNSSITIIVVIVLIIAAIAYTSVDRNPKSELAKVRVQAGWLLNGEFANVCSAIVNGYYRDAGMDVELLPGGPTGASFIVATNAVALDDSITLGIDGDLVPLIRGKARTVQEGQIQVKVFGAFWNENPYGFMVRTDSGLTSIKDFAKRKPDGSKYKIGVTADSVIQYAIAKYIGVPVEELELVIVGFDASPFLSKQVDALAGYWTTQAYELDKAGIAYTFLSSSEIPGFDQPSMIAVASEKTIREKKELLVAWLNATNKGVGFVVANPEKAAEHILDSRCGGPSFDKAQETWLIRKSLPLFDEVKPGWIYEKQVADFAKAYAELGQIPHAPSLSELVDYSILQAIYK
ncbi:MAG: ABC transporter substrate-binding protein [Patescibacteria group bacterium]